MIVFLIVVVIVVLLFGLEMFFCDELLKVRKLKIRMNFLRVVSYKKNGIYNELFIFIGYFFFFMNFNCVYIVIYWCKWIMICGCKLNFFFFVNYWFIFWYINRGFIGIECFLIFFGWFVFLLNCLILGFIMVVVINVVILLYICIMLLLVKF